jgi:hypothetical protein
MSDNVTVTVQDVDLLQVAVQEVGRTTAGTSIYNPVTIPSISDIGNVDTTTLNNGAILVYKSNTSRWTSTTTLDAQNMEGGEF